MAAHIPAYPAGGPLPSLGVRTVHMGREVLVSPAGEIDVDTAPQLHSVLAACLEQRPAAVVVSLADVSFCDCAGLNVLLGAHQAARAGRAEFRCVDPAPVVWRLLTATDTTHLLAPGGPAA